MLLRSVRSVALACALAASAAPLAACGGSSTVTEPSSTAQTGATIAPIAVDVHGPARRVVDALAQVPLRADQRSTIEQMAKDGEARRAPVLKARADLVNAIADQVQAGSIDRAALQPKIDALTAAQKAMQPQNRAAFEKLHELLTKDQRAAFVTAMQDHPGRRHGRGGLRGRMQKWATDLNLTPDQQTEIREKVRATWEARLAATAAGPQSEKVGAAEDGVLAMRGHQMHERWHATLEAFRGDKFSMAEVAPVQNDKPLVDRFAGHVLTMLETALPILTPDQRSAAAQKLRARAAKLDAADEAPVPVTP